MQIKNLSMSASEKIMEAEKMEKGLVAYIKAIEGEPTAEQRNHIFSVIASLEILTGKQYHYWEEQKSLCVVLDDNNPLGANLMRSNDEPEVSQGTNVSLNIKDDEEQGCQILNVRKEFLLDKMVEYLCNYGDVDLVSLGADEYVSIEDAYNNCLDYITRLVGKNDSKPEFWEGVLGFTKEELLTEGMEWVYENESEIVEEKKQPLTVAELEQVMKDYGVVIRRLPDFIRYTYEAKYLDKHPDGILVDLPGFNRKMLLVDDVPECAGKYIYTVCKNADVMVPFYESKGLKSEHVFDSIEELVDDVKKNCEKIRKVREAYPDEANNMKELVSNGNHIFEVVKVAPLGYEIWNIGKHAPEGYVPFCRLKAVQPFDGCREIETDTLRAVKSEHWDVIMDAVGYGPATLKEMEKYVKKHKDNPSKADIVAKMEKALPYMREIDWR